jgi:glycerol-3-phosphate dehydrogenase
MKLSVIGLGAMGSALARAFRGNGHDETVWNRTVSRCEPLLQRESPSPARCRRRSKLPKLNWRLTDRGAFDTLYDASWALADER